MHAWIRGALALVMVGCGSSSHTTPPVAPVAPGAQTPGDAPRAATTTFVLRGQGRVGFVAVRRGGRPFMSTSDDEVEWAELTLRAGQASATLLAHTKELDFMGEVTLADMKIVPSRRTLTDGWFVPERIRVTEVTAGGDLLGATTLPRVVSGVPTMNVRIAAAEAAIGEPAWAREERGALRVLLRGATGTLRDASGARVVGRLEVPAMPGPGHPEDHYRPFFARVVEERGGDVKLLVRDMGATIEVWTASSALDPAFTGRRAELLEAQDMPLTMLAGGGPPSTTCAQPLNVYVHEGPGVVAVGSLRSGASIRKASVQPVGPDETPIDLGHVGPGDLVPFVRSSALARCATETTEPIVVAAPGRGLVAGPPSAPPAPATPAPPPPERTVLSVEGDASVGSLTTTAPVSDAARVVAALRPRFRQCYRAGLASDPSMSGAIAVTAEVEPDGTVSMASATRNTGLSPSVAACLVNVLRRAQFTPPGGHGATIVVPINLAQRSN